MRAILIDAFQEKLEEIYLPVEVNAFQSEIRSLLKTDTPRIIHSNELLTVIFDEDAHWKETPAFWSNLMDEQPMFGNVICVGRNPITKIIEGLYELYQFENFNVRWCDFEETGRYQKVVREFAKNNRT